MSESKVSYISIQCIKTIEQHPNADKLLVVTFEDNDYQVIIDNNGEKFVKGQLVVFVKSGTILKHSTKWIPSDIKKYITSNCDKKKLRRRKRNNKEFNPDYYYIQDKWVRSSISEGIIFHINEVFPNETNLKFIKNQDITKLLKNDIKKPEKPKKIKETIVNTDCTPKSNSFPSKLIHKNKFQYLQNRMDKLKDLFNCNIDFITIPNGVPVTYLINPNDDQFLICNNNKIKIAYTDTISIEYNTSVHNIFEKIYFGCSVLIIAIMYFNDLDFYNVVFYFMLYTIIIIISLISYSSYLIYTKIKKNEDIMNSNCIYNNIAKKYRINSILRKTPYYAISGYICGPNLNKNLMELKQNNFYVTNIVNLNTRKSLDSFKQISDFCNNVGLQYAKYSTINFITSQDDKSSLKTLYSHIKNFSNQKYDNTNNDIEGLIIRSLTKYNYVYMAKYTNSSNSTFLDKYINEPINIKYI